MPEPAVWVDGARWIIGTGAWGEPRGVGMELAEGVVLSEHRAALHAAINHLPRGLRMVLIVCDLEGRSPGVAARQLGWPAGRLKRRLLEARACLRIEMARQGVVLPLAASHGLGPWLGVGESVVSLRLIEATVAAAARCCGHRSRGPAPDASAASCVRRARLSHAAGARFWDRNGNEG